MGGEVAASNPSLIRHCINAIKQCYHTIKNKLEEKIKTLAQKIFYGCVFSLPAGTLSDKSMTVKKSLGDKIAAFFIYFYRGCDNQKGTTCGCLPPPMDTNRMQKGLNIYSALTEQTTLLEATTTDGKKIQYCLVKAQDFRAKVESMGCTWAQNQETKNLELAPPENLTPEWLEFNINVLSKLGWKEVSRSYVIPKDQLTPAVRKKLEKMGIEILEQGDNYIIMQPEHQSDEWKKFISKQSWQFSSKYITSQSQFDFPKEPVCMLHNHTLARSMPMDRKRMGVMLGQGLDVCFYDYRGFLNSDPDVATEGGCYLDSEAVMSELLKTYQERQIWATGFCAGTVVAVHLKTEHPNINLCLENGFVSLQRDVVNAEKVEEIQYGLSPLVRRIVNFGFDGIKSSNSIVEQTGFDIEQFSRIGSLAKLGKTIIVSAKQDTFVAPNAASELARIAKSFSEVVSISGKGRDHSSELVLENGSDAQKQFMQVVLGA